METTRRSKIAIKPYFLGFDGKKVINGFFRYNIKNNLWKFKKERLKPRLYLAKVGV